MSDATAVEMPASPQNASEPASVRSPSSDGAPGSIGSPTSHPPEATRKESSKAEPPAATRAMLWLTDRDVTLFGCIAAVVFVLLVVRWGQLSGWGMHEIEIDRLTPLEYSYRLDPNDATWVELAQLDGVGEALAIRIVEDREANGPFRSIEDLDRVKGIGPKLLERLRPYLRIETRDPQDERNDQESFVNASAASSGR